MTSTPCQSEALDRLVAPWAAKIAKSCGTTVEAIVANAENVRAALQELKPHGRKARQLLAARSGLSRPMMSKLETIGRHATLPRRKADFLPPSVGALYVLARKSWPEFKRAVMMDLRGKSRAGIKALFAEPPAPKPSHRLMTILVPPELDDAVRCVLIADIEATLARITDNHKVDLDVCLSAPMRKASQALSPQSDEEPAEIIEEPEAHDTGNKQQPCPHVKDPAEERACVTDEAGRAGGMQHHEPDAAR
jgi:hypothetical protein